MGRNDSNRRGDERGGRRSGHGNPKKISFSPVLNTRGLRGVRLTL